MRQSAGFIDRLTKAIMTTTYAFGMGWGAGDELLAWCRERFAAGNGMWFR